MDLDLHDLLFDLAAEMPVDLATRERERSTLRRARGHRAASAALTGLTAVVLVVAGFATVRALSPEAPIGIPGGTPTGPSPVPSPTPTLGPGVVLPEAVAATHAAIVEAARARDFEALGALIDPNRFSYNFSDGHDPIPEWMADPSVLDTIVAILELPPGIRETPSGDFYVWPYFVESDLTALSMEERELLATIGIGEAELRDMIAFGGYIGPRTTIDPDGAWLNYVEGGD